MKELIEVVERFQAIAGAKIDCNFGQGVEAVRQHLAHYRREYQLNELLEGWQQEIGQLNRLIAPNTLPSDYSYFLTHYGGLAIETQKGLEDFTIFGTGPMSRIWADGTILDYNEELAIGHPLYIAVWVDWDGLKKASEEQALRWEQEGHQLPENPFEGPFPPSDRPSFFLLDVAGVVAKHAILLRKDSFPEHTWVKVADTFTDWLHDMASYPLLPLDTTHELD